MVDYDKAYYWFEKSATAKNNEALDGLGMIYFAGLGKDKDFQKAEEYFLEALLHKPICKGFFSDIIFK
ncbi:hypothetical protein [Acinetobacter indicus]|uniref:hypothetical protein n=1 Tax=Acinetobacter indicus TaxID=756892 RepID=UPI00224BA955|nr:hypothetical protein [Acinetobacter indicus]